MTDTPETPAPEDAGVVTLDLVVDNASVQNVPAESDNGYGRDSGPVGPIDAAALPPGCPVTPLGLLGDVYFYLDAKNQLRAVKAKDHSRLNLWALCGDRTDWLYNHFPRLSNKGDTTGWRPEQVAERLMASCARMGLVDGFNLVRGIGCWLGSNGELVMHCGDAVLVQGVEHRPGRIGDHVYPAASPGPRPALETQPPREEGPAHKLRDLFENWSWQRPEIDPHLLLGWVVAAIAAGALDWRPLCWITGDSGTGKSTLHTVIDHVFDGALVRASDASAAGIWQKVGHASLPIALDEMEAKEDNRRNQAIVELARAAASGAFVLRGGGDHNSAEFTARSCFLFSSILMLPMLSQDRNRMAILELDRLANPDPPELDPAVLSTLGAGLRRRLIDRWPFMGETLRAWRGALTRAGHGGRTADVYGTLLACADLALHDLPPTSDDLDIWGERMDAILAASRADEASDHERCLQHMLTTAIDPWRSGQQRTVASWVVEAAGRGKPDGSEGDSTSANQALEAHGLKVHHIGKYDQRELFLAVAGNHQALARIFRDTKWAATSGAPGGWNQSLARVDGCQRRHSLRFNGLVMRCSLLPLASVIGDPGGGETAP